MYKSFLITLVIFLYCLNLKANNDTTKVLFIGNSITYYNDMPNMFRDIANNRGENVTVSMHAPGGTGFTKQ